MDLIPGNAPHWHLILNHFPSVGMVIAFGLLLASFYLKSEDLNKTSLVLFVLMSLLAIPTYVTGIATKEVIGNNPDISLALITAHQDAALLAFVCLGATGCLSWLALWQYRRLSHIPKWNRVIVLVLAFLSIGFLIQTGSMGGDINHPEIRIGEEIIVAQSELGPTAVIKEYVTRVPWFWVMMETAHFIGMALLFGVVLWVALRVLGFAKDVPFAALHRLLPLGVLGLLINIGTGMAFLITDPGRYTAIDAFYWKMALISMGGVAILYFTIFDHPWSLKAGDNAAPITKLIAATTILLWAGVLIYGRLLPYLEG